MALANVNILRQNGGILAQPADTDGISGIVFYTTEASTSGKYLLSQASDANGLFGTSGNSICQFHIDEYFAKSDYQLYISVATSVSTDLKEIVELQRFANGDIKQIGVYDGITTSFSGTNLTKVQTQVELCETEYAPLQAVYSVKLGGTIESVASATNLTTFDNYGVSFTVGQNNDSNLEPFKSKSAQHIGDIGSVIGTIASAKVSENIGNVGKFNLTNITIPGFTDGSLLSSKAKSFLDSLDTKNYLFIRKFVGLSGSYYNFDYTATNPATDDFHMISVNRTYNKAFTNLRQVYLNYVNSNIKLDKTGKIAVATAEFLGTIGDAVLKSMKANDEISDYSIVVDRVLTDKTLTIIAKLVPIGIAKTINIKLGFSLTV